LSFDMLMVSKVIIPLSLFFLQYKYKHNFHRTVELLNCLTV
jgi:hypothetical protein